MTSILLLLLATSCASPFGPTVPLDTAFVLEPGECVQVEGTDTAILFIRVEGDSRCPADAICIQGGDAIVRIAASGPGVPARQYELHTGDLLPVVHEDLTITLVELQPYPFSSLPPIGTDEYRATLRVTR